MSSVSTGTSKSRPQAARAGTFNSPTGDNASGGGSHDGAHAAARDAGEEGSTTAATSSPMSSPPDGALFHSAITGPEGGEVEPAYEEAAAEDLLPPPDFKPFFTIVEDAEGTEHHHPTVHYIFADDDPEDLTSAMLAAIDQGAAVGTRPELEERVILLDMDADGKQIITASSLSARWQATKVDIGQAPSWGGASQGADGGLMLKISGKEIAKPANKQQKKGTGSIEELVRSFGERLDGLGEILGTHGEAVSSPEVSTTQEKL
ncbi:hypothetical protein B0A54_00384 [Friedmanniomyces endolithicus]|uniref:Uncharacterized protein n=1 Tax=Friedmanniomyces endolithicus TaxID=329885 RepID=A0A4U0VMG5_9PEZI|nr:hypothetical protein LTS09_012147 [Friedmanniomyces endolithicus]TKA49715.1 hypothetical protein B0A54_00384 [Friedmanniomyces endolithicus]